MTSSIPRPAPSPANQLRTDESVSAPRFPPVRIALAGPDVLERLLTGAMAKPLREFELVAREATANNLVAACREQRVDILVLHNQALNLGNIDSLAELKRRCGSTKFLLIFNAMDDDEILCAINAGVEGVVEDSSSAAEVAAALERLASGLSYFCGRSSRVLVDKARGLRLTFDAKNSTLTAREKDVVLLIAAGRTNKEIATALNLSCATVDTHRRNLMCKLGTHNAAELVRYCYSNGWLQG